MKVPHLGRLVISNDPHGLRVESQEEEISRFSSGMGGSLFASSLAFGIALCASDSKVVKTVLPLLFGIDTSSTSVIP